MVALAELRAASFRGAGFRVPSDHAEEGRHSIIHQYPDSPLRYVEDNGYCPPEFTITAVLHGKGLLGQFSALRSALNVPGPGTLHHPYYGTQFCSVIGPWKVKREDRDSGVLELEIKFAVTGPAVFPGRFGSIAAVVSGLASTLVSSAFAAFAAQYGTPVLSDYSVATLSDATALLGATVVERFGSVTGSAIPASHLVNYPERYAASGDMLAPVLVSMFRAPLEDLAATYSNERIISGVKAIDQVALTMQATAERTPTTTLDYVVRRKCLLTYSIYVRIACLSSMADAMASMTYVTADSVHASVNQLRALYESIPTDDLPVDIGNAVSELVASALDVLYRQEIQLPRINVLEVYEYPASVLAYMLYDDDKNPSSEPHIASKTDTLIDLNMRQSPCILDRTAYVLRDETA